MKQSTQNFLEVDKVKQGIIILKNKSFRSILMVSSLNFALKSDDERSAIIYQFQNFLNSLDFTCQIIVQSRQLNITGYLDQLKKIEQEQKNELLKIQTFEYRKFIESLVETGTIMSKSFFLSVPFTLFEAREKQKKRLFTTPKLGALTDEDFNRCKIQLTHRIEYIISGLRKCGLKTVPLNTLEIIELLWSLHHPLRAETGYYPEIPPEFIK
ncbi:MAG: hypothetical protein U9Q27_00965 [Patescibacteria group bacterium]|nr:hypothetical protein [Patescibacteria group bacterium]